MRKYLSLIIVLCLCRTVATAADFYLVGKGNDWSFKQEFKFTESNGVHTLHIDSFNSADFGNGFKIAESGWKSQYGSTQRVTFNTSIGCVNSTSSADNIKFPKTMTVAGATLRFDVTDASAPKLTVVPDLYLVGDVTGWSNTRSDYRFNENNGIFSLVVSDLDGFFRIAGGANDANGDWLLKYGGPTEVTPGNTYTLRDGSDTNMKLAGSVSGSVLLTFNLASLSLEVKALNAVTVDSDLYLAHNINGTWWSNHPDFKFEHADGIYTLHVDALPTEFKVVTAGWETQLGAATADFMFDSPMACVEGYGNNFVRPAEYTTIAGATLTVDLRGSVPTLTVMPDLYLAGELNSWNNTDAAYRFTRTGDVYTLSIPELSGKFRIAGGTAPEWAVQYGGAANMNVETEYDCIPGSGNDMSVASPVTDALITFNHATMKLTVSSRATVDTSKGLYLAGDINNWASDNGDYRFTEANGIYTLTLPRMSGEFKIVTPDWNSQFGCTSPLVYGRTYSCVLSANGANMSLAEGVGTDVTITFDVAARTVQVDGMPTLFLVGDFNNWAPSQRYAFEYANGVYTLSTSDFSGPFKVTTADGATSFGMAMPTPLALGRNYAVAHGADSILFNGSTADRTGRVRITLTPNGTADTTPTGVDEVAGDTDAPVEYYNLQGVRVYTPSHGIYIRRTGTIVEKIAIQ